MHRYGASAGCGRSLKSQFATLKDLLSLHERGELAMLIDAHL
jgi:hypothetical protein